MEFIAGVLFGMMNGCLGGKARLSLEELKHTVPSPDIDKVFGLQLVEMVRQR